MRARKIINGLFVGLLLAVTLAGLWRTFFRPKDVNSYENRWANKTERFTLAGFMSGTFQNSVDAALGDQVQLAEVYKRVYNTVSSGYLKEAMEPIVAVGAPRYVNFMGRSLFGPDHITYRPRPLEELREALDAKVDNYNGVFAQLPQTEFYVYYVEKDTDIDFETGEKTGAWEYLQDRLALPKERMGRFEVRDFPFFDKEFYKTDGHWNGVGSLRGYRETAALLGVDEPLLEPVGEAELGVFSGAKASGTGADRFREIFTAYRYDYPDMAVTVNGAPAIDYGNQETYFSGKAKVPVTYGIFYGADNGETTFSTGRTDRENLLVIGESYDNAILKLLASHFNCTYSVDLRYYSHYMGQEFRLSRYLEERGITKVLLMGNLDFFLLPEFCLEG